MVSVCLKYIVTLVTKAYVSYVVFFKKVEEIDHLNQDRILFEKIL